MTVSPTAPVPRVAPTARTPSRYTQLMAVPSIFSSHDQRTDVSGGRPLATRSDQARRSSSLNTLSSDIIASRCSNGGKAAVRAMAPVVPRRGAERARTGRLIHDSLGLLSSKWAVDVLLALGDGTRRYHQLLADLEPISEKVLTQTLRAMERDGLVGRRVHPEVPPRVEYALTPLGTSLAGPLRALGSWSLAHGKRVDEARDRFDERLRAKRAA